MALYWLRRTSWFIVVAVVVLALSACVDDVDPQSALGTPSPRASQEECADYPPPFEASYLPTGFSARLRKGAGLFKGTDYPTEGLLGYHRGPRETIHVNFQTDPGPLPYEPASPKPMRVLGNEGRIATIEGGFSVEFSDADCDFRMDTYGISRRETVRVAQGLRPRN